MGGFFSSPEPEQELKKGPALVCLSVYNVGWSSQVRHLNTVCHPVGTGVYHCAVEVYGLEYSFGFCQKGSGVFYCNPRRCSAHSFRESIVVGETSLDERDVLDLIKLLRQDWQGAGYNILSRNCCHFSDELCRWLGVGAVPNWVKNMAGTGVAIARTRRSLSACCKKLCVCARRRRLSDAAAVEQPAARNAKVSCRPVTIGSTSRA